MLQVSIPATIRSSYGKGSSRQLRMNDQTPAVLYSGGNEAITLQLNSTDLYKNLVQIHGRNAVVTLSIEGDAKGERHVLVKEVQKNPVSDFVVHVDFLEIALEKPMVFAVPLHYAGIAKGVDLGGELHVHQHSVKLQGRPLDMPDAIEVPIKNLARGDSLSFGELTLPEKVEMLNDPAATCIAVS